MIITGVIYLVIIGAIFLFIIIAVALNHTHIPKNSTLRSKMSEYEYYRFLEQWNNSDDDAMFERTKERILSND